MNYNIWSHSLYVYIDDNLYRWTIPILGGGHIWFIKFPGIPGIKKNKGLKLIKSFKNEIMPEINPQNIMEKIKTYLMFL